MQHLSNKQIDFLNKALNYNLLDHYSYLGLFPDFNDGDDSDRLIADKNYWLCNINDKIKTILTNGYYEDIDKLQLNSIARYYKIINRK